MIHRHFEESLDLVGVQVHGDDAAHTGRGEQVAHQFGADGGSGLVLAVLTGIAEVGDHGDDAACRSALGGINGDQQLDDVVGRRESRLDDEHIAPADALVVIDLDFPVLELQDIH